MAKKQEQETALNEEATQEQETPLQPYDRVRLTFEDGTFENCFYVEEGVYSKANSAGNAFKVGNVRTGVVKVEKV